MNEIVKVLNKKWYEDFIMILSCLRKPEQSMCRVCFGGI